MASFARKWAKRLISVLISYVFITKGFSRILNSPALGLTGGGGAGTV